MLATGVRVVVPVLSTWDRILVSYIYRVLPFNPGYRRSLRRSFDLDGTWRSLVVAVRDASWKPCKLPRIHFLGGRVVARVLGSGIRVVELGPAPRDLLRVPSGTRNKPQVVVDADGGRGRGILGTEATHDVDLFDVVGTLESVGRKGE